MLDLMPVLLMLLFSLALSVGTATIVLVARRARLRPRARRPRQQEPPPVCTHTCFLRRPAAWLAIKSRSLLAVQSALGMRHTKPCPLLQGLAGEEKLFICPPVKGWILVTGSGLPDPSDDVDACFRFLVELSRKLGHVQYFSASHMLYHHAWVRADAGRIVRAYAWAGRTLWRQGERTQAENELGVKCFGYTEPSERSLFGQPDLIAMNVDKVPLLAARWSLDPARLEERALDSERGIAGEPSLRY
ncbi:MAG: hypothetical protein C5B50_11745 [Verrucomicrobia bacterium]|nr:MAG: hypothetical protein C5B50_11745 [Verrucomicrobiota bacterium]